MGRFDERTSASCSLAIWVEGLVVEFDGMRTFGVAEGTEFADSSTRSMESRTLGLRWESTVVEPEVGEEDRPDAIESGF